MTEEMTPLKVVRLLCSDVGGEDKASFIFTDEEIEAFLLLSEQNVRLAAAEALRTIAANEAQVSKRIKFLELSTDGPAVAAALIKAAESLEQKADDECDIEIASFAPDYAAFDTDGLPILP